MEYKTANLESNTDSLFKTLWQSRESMNVTLVCDENKEIKAHKHVLCSGSSFFETVLLS